MTDKTLSTFDLAKKLGIIRTRKVSNFLHPQISSKPSTSKEQNNLYGPFSFFIVIDFESTCWPDKRNQNPSPEVIEFPAVLYDAKNRKVPDDPLAVFHGYVMPTEEPILSKFCTELTGIDQDKVNSGCPLPTTIFLFKKWIEDISRKFSLSLNEVSAGRNTCTFVTWTDWDLKICLENECKRKNISKPRYLDAWIDLKWTYQKFYGRKPKGLNGALKETGLEFDGREHSGIADAKNTAKLLGKMLDDRCGLGITKVINAAKVDPKLKYDESSLSMVSIKSFLAKNSTSKPALIPPKIDLPLKKVQGSKQGLRDITNGNQTLNATKRTPFTGVRTTPPLCSCGRRSKRLVVSKPGPNQGRTFFACSLKKSEPSRINSGCGFFKWEATDLGQSPNFSSSKTFVSNSTTKTFDKPTSKSFASFSNKQNVESVSCLPNFTPKLPISKTVMSMLSKENNENPKTVFMSDTNNVAAKQNVYRSFRSNLPISKSLTSFSSKQNDDKLVKQNDDKSVKQNTDKTTVASKSLTSLPSTERSRPTLGSARRSNFGLFSTPPNKDGDVTTPEMKRARLNFKAFTSGTRKSCVEQQYFGNVPLNSH